MNSSHPSQEGFEGLSDLLPLSVASLCNNVNDCIFICSCGRQKAVTFAKHVFVELWQYKCALAFRVAYRIPSWLSSALERQRQGQNWLQAGVLASADLVEGHS